MNQSKVKHPWFVKGDLDGLFGLAVDNLVQVLFIATLCTQLCGFTEEIIYFRVLPGVAVSLLIGNLYYAWHARRVGRRDGNPNVTALPYGINTPSVFAYIFFILAPVYGRYKGEIGAEAAGELAWKAGLIACIGSGLIEFLSGFIGGWIRRVLPRAALLSALAAIGIIFIASPFAFQIFERPLVAIPPLFVVLIGYFSRVRLPGGIPSGLAAVILGTVLAWTVPYGLGPEIMSAGAVRESIEAVGFRAPQFFGHDVWLALKANPDLLLSFLGIIIPMGVINAVGSLQNIESAEAAGDRFATGPCLAVNGIGSIAAGLFGSCFPTTIYIGHPGWKALGARHGYSILNGVLFTALFLLGLGQFIVRIIPMEAGMAIVVWIGIIITAQAFSAVPTRHFPAVALGFFPAVAMMGVFLLPFVIFGVGATHGLLPMVQQHGAHLADPARRVDDWWPIGVYALAGANSGFVITCMMFSGIGAFLIDRRFKAAAVCSFVAAGLTLVGLQHAYRIEPDPAGMKTVQPAELMAWQRTEAMFNDTSLYLDVPAGTFLHRGYRIALAYAVMGGVLLGIHHMRKRGRFEDIAVDPHGGRGECDIEEE